MRTYRGLAHSYLLNDICSLVVCVLFCIFMFPFLYMYRFAWLVPLIIRFRKRTSESTVYKNRGYICDSLNGRTVVSIPKMRIRRVYSLAIRVLLNLTVF